MDGGPGSRTDRWWDETSGDADDPVVGATALLVLGAGLGSLFGVPVLAAVDFWIIFVVGYAVLVPLVSLLRGASDTDDGNEERQRFASEESRGAGDHTTEDVDAALARLRERYARGDLSDEQFERKLEVLLETDIPENARERIGRRRPEYEADRTERVDPERERSP
ncbi:SHOCT domain-containing protein [Halobellus captivus]|uniref:SHOCT domain-containing protein n=1 Tax=Halobellus captivus TaxID=2592614 RepID=UPI0011A1D618|nr:SHOCT domain-containing protein [Halobellus captivus]